MLFGHWNKSHVQTPKLAQVGSGPPKLDIPQGGHGPLMHFRCGHRRQWARKDVLEGGARALLSLQQLHLSLLPLFSGGPRVRAQSSGSIMWVIFPENVHCLWFWLPVGFKMLFLGSFGGPWNCNLMSFISLGTFSAILYPNVASVLFYFSFWDSNYTWIRLLIVTPMPLVLFFFLFVSMLYSGYFLLK